MGQIEPVQVGFSRRGVGVVCLILCLCLCVLVQMLGVPVTLLSLLILDTPAESLSEDFSVLPVLLNPPAPSHIAFHVENQGLIDLPIFSTAIFHPPHG